MVYNRKQQSMKKLFITMIAVLSLVATNLLIAAEGVLEEIVVTAQKREADVLLTPIAIEVFDGDSLSDNGIEDMDDFTQVSSSFNINTSSIDAQIYIRGVGSQNLGSGAYGSTGVYVDGVYYPRPRQVSNSIGKLDDVESVQLLKGPQGTIFGRNATAGALVMTTRTPQIDEAANGFLSVTAGDFGVKELQGAIFSGLSETTAGSLNFSIHESDGFIENQGTGRDLDDDDGFKVAGKFAWSPTDNLDFVLNGAYYEDKRNSVPFQQVGHFDNDMALPGLNNPQTLYAGTILQFAGAFGVGLTPAQQGGVIGLSAGLQFSNEVGVTSTTNVPEQVQGVLSDGTTIQTGGDYDADLNSGGLGTITQFSLSTRYSLDSFDLVNVLSIMDAEEESSAAVLRPIQSSVPDFTTIPGLTPLQAGTLAFIAGNGSELSFSGYSPSESYAGDFYAVSTNSNIEWIAGLYYFYEEGENQTTAGAFNFDQTISLTNWEVESVAPYVEVNVPVSDALTLTAGVRYTKEDAEVTDLLPARVAVGADLGTLTRSDSQTTYNAKLAYTPNDDWLLYGGYSTGFKSGSVNPSAPENGQVEPEEISSIEAGFKGSICDDSIVITGAAFYYEYDNLQLNVLNVTNSSVVLIDGAEAEITGAELNVAANLSDNTSLTFGATLLDHEYVTNAVVPATLTGGAPIPIVIEGNALAMTPDAVVVAGIVHRFPMGNGGDITLNASVNYNSGFWIDTRNAFGSGGDEDDDFSVVNASLKYNHVDDLFSVKLYANNVFDEEYFRGGLEAAGGLSQLASAGRPLHFGATFKYNF